MWATVWHPDAAAYRCSLVPALSLVARCSLGMIGPRLVVTAVLAVVAAHAAVTDLVPVRVIYGTDSANPEVQLCPVNFALQKKEPAVVSAYALGLRVRSNCDLNGKLLCGFHVACAWGRGRGAVSACTCGIGAGSDV